jgi:hypothetical protein
MRRAAQAGVAGDVLRTSKSRLLPILAASTLGMIGLGEVATAGSMAPIATRSAVTTPVDVASKVAGNLPRRPLTRQGSYVGGAAGMAAAGVRSVHDRKLYAEREVAKGAVKSATEDKSQAAERRISENFIDKTVGVESGGRADAKNPNSTALGQGQFIKGTWLHLVEKHKPEWADGWDEEDILEQRKKPEAARWAIRMYAEENIPALESAGVEVNDASLYLSHMLDGPVAAKLYKAAPDSPVRDIVSERAFRANKALMNGKKVKDLLAWAERKMGSRGPVVSEERLRRKQRKERKDA